MTQSTDRPRMALWMRLVLFGSLALNLAVVGIVAGMAFRGGPDRDGPPRGRDYVTPYTRAFTEDQRRDIGDRLRREFRRERPDGLRILADFRDTLTLLRAEPFDSEAFRSALETQDSRAQARQQLGQEVLIRYLSGLSPELRAAYADRLEAQLDRLARHSRDHGFRKERDND